MRAILGIEPEEEKERLEATKTREFLLFGAAKYGECP